MACLISPLMHSLFWVCVLEPTLYLSACERPIAVSGSLCASDVHASCFYSLTLLLLAKILSTDNLNFWVY